MKNKLSGVQVLVLVIGAVLGGFVAQLTSKVPFLAFLSFGDTFGFSPVTLDLGLLSLTFGLSIEVTLAAILGLILALLICKQIR